MKDFAYVTWDSSLGNWQPFLHFHSCSRTLRVTGREGSGGDDDDDDLVIMMIIIIICSSNSVKL